MSASSAAVVSNSGSVVSSHNVGNIKGFVEDDDSDGVWINNKFYPHDDGFEEIEVKSPRPPKKDTKVKGNFKKRPNMRFAGRDEFDQ